RGAGAGWNRWRKPSRHSPRKSSSNWKSLATSCSRSFGNFRDFCVALFASRARVGRAHQTMDVLQARRSDYKKSEAHVRGTRLGREYFRTKKVPSGGGESRAGNKPRGVWRENPG